MGAVDETRTRVQRIGKARQRMVVRDETREQRISVDRWRANGDKTCRDCRPRFSSFLSFVFVAFRFRSFSLWARLIRFYAGNRLFLTGTSNRQLSVRLFQTEFRLTCFVIYNSTIQAMEVCWFRVRCVNCITCNCLALLCTPVMCPRWKINGGEGYLIRYGQRRLIRGCL